MPARLSDKLLAVVGLLGVAFFWLTDPRFGLLCPAAGENAVDAARYALAGTAFGVAGSAAVVGVGLWLVTRRGE